MSGRWFGCGWARDGAVTPWAPRGMVRALLAEIGGGASANDDIKGHLIALAEMFARHSGRSLATVSNLVSGGGRFFERLRGEASCTLRTYERVLTWFDGNWPADLPWPADVPRPKQKKDAA